MDDITQQIEELKLEIEKLREEIKNIPPHKHCVNCGISIPPDKDFCSTKCEEEWNRMVKKKKNITYFWLLLMGILLLILLVTSGGL